MKPFVLILMSIAALAKTSTAQTEAYPFKTMTCHIQAAGTSECTGLPTLHSGVLVISKEGTFELKGYYHACFMVDEATKYGKYQVSYLNGAIRLELLTTKTIGMSDAPDFPRTLGIVTLNRDRLDGELIDLSAALRGHSYHPENFVSLTLQCKEVNE